MATSKTTLPQRGLTLFITISALGFTVSSLPGHQKASATRSLSSEKGDCDYLRQLHDSDDGADCQAYQQINGIEINGTVKIKAEPATQVDHLLPPDQRIPKKVTKLRIITDIEADVCESCKDKKRLQDEFSINIADINHIDEKLINEQIAARFDKNAHSLARTTSAAREALEKAKEKKLALANCEINNRGQELQGKKRSECFIDQMDNLSDAKAAKLFETKVRKDIETKLSSDDANERKEGRTLLTEIYNIGAGGKVVDQSIADLIKLGKYKEQAIALRDEVQKLGPNDPRRSYLEKLARQDEVEADKYFASRGVQVGKSVWPDNYDYAGAMTADLQRMQNLSDQSYNQALQKIVGDHATAVAQVITPQVPYSGGKSVQFQPASSATGGFQPAKNVNNNSLLNSPVYQYMNGASVNGAGAGAVGTGTTNAAGRRILPQQFPAQTVGAG